MSKICTDINQSKKLLELGIDVNTADMWYQHIGYSITDGKEKPTYFPMVIRDWKSDDDIPAWSLTALLGLIEWDYNLEKTLFDQSDLFTHSIVCDDLDFRTYEYDDPIDSAFEMVVWLKENEKI